MSEPVDPSRHSWLFCNMWCPALFKQSEPLRENTGQDDYNVHRSLYRMPLGALVRAARPFQAKSAHICLPHTMQYAGLEK